MTKNHKITKIVIAVLCAIVASITFCTLFTPVLVQKTDNGKTETIVQKFTVADAIKGGLYDYKNDTKDPSTNQLINYNKLSEMAQYYFQTFILLSPKGVTPVGSLVAVFLMLLLIVSLLMVVATIVTIGTGNDYFVAQVIFGVLHIAFTVAIALCVPRLTDMVSNDVLVQLNCKIQVGPAWIIILISGISYLVFVLFGKFFAKFSKVR
ncbi:MAG: hypothetical protein IKV38_03550 [Clostridia bacterium]|nr:hypothetical protein [Clostridia bacterium]